ncbi:MAG: hypothetical protein D6723_19485 [Acidobacteria bacterium]|nr:MAG: hypothetical protein D6723_19485 [Acidobacteriota bacterium]
MAFDVENYKEFIRFLAEHPEWRSELRQLLLMDELVELREAIRGLTEAQARTEERVGRLEEAVARLAEAQARTEERVGRVEEQLAALAEAQRRTEERVEALAEAQRQAAEQIRDLAETVKGLTDTVSGLKGRVLEFSFGNKAGAYFGPLLQKLRIVAPYTLADALQARLSREEFKDVLLLDLLVCGQLREHPEAPEIWLAIEVSAVVDRVDVERARRRAALLNRAGYRAIPVVAGERATRGAEDEARAHKVIMVEDGHLSLWDEALRAWGVKPESTPN